ncbi:MAG: ankyrin repeat domain-containing protein [Vulcanimicrobiota bacterium]
MHSSGEVIDGRYRIVRLLGKGGLSHVYEAVDLTFNRRCALKEFTIREGGDEERLEVREHFTREMEMLSRLSHPGLPQIYDSLTFDGKDLLALELIEGKTLEELARDRSEPFPEEQVSRWSVTILDILDYLHSQNPPVIYRDLKPQNIMITPEGELRFIDFGIARLFNPVKEQDTVFMGTPGFASPEQFRRSQSDPRSDIYSLGALMHYLLTLKDPGLRPFDFEPVSLCNPAVSKLIEKATQKALEIKPDNRFQNAAEMRKVLLGEISFEELSTRGFIIINPKEVQLIGLKPGKERAAEITVRSSRENQKICARLTSEHPGLVVEPSSFDSEYATVTVRPERRKFRRGRKVTSSITLSTESSKIAIPVTVQYEPTLLGRIPRAYFSLLGFLLPAALFAIFYDKISNTISDSPVNSLFIIIFYIIIVGGIAFLPTFRKKELKPLALAGNIALVLLPFVFVYLYCYILPKQAVRNCDSMAKTSAKSMRSICNRILLWGPDRNVLDYLAFYGDHSSIPFIIWAYCIGSRMPESYMHEESDYCKPVLIWITNRKADGSSDEMWKWYFRNRNKTDMELWTDGFRLQGYQVSLKGDTESVDRLLTMMGQKRGIPRGWLIYNGCRMLEHYNSDLVNPRINRAFESGTDEEKSGAKSYCRYLANRLYQESMRGDITAFRTMLRRSEGISGIDDYISGRLTDIRSFWHLENTQALKISLLHLTSDKDIGDLLIHRGQNVNSKDWIGQTPLYYAVRNNNEEMVKFLLDNGAIIDAIDNDGNTPLASTYSLKMIKLLVEGGADINVKSAYGDTALFKVIQNCDSNYHKGFFCSLKDRLTSNKEEKKNLELVRMLLSKGSDVNERCTKGMTSVFIAQSPEILRCLLKHGADVNVRDNDGRTPLHNVTSAVSATLLIERGVDVNARDRAGCTPLHDAQSCEIAQLLISRGADVNARDNKGMTPLFLLSEAVHSMGWVEKLKIARLFIDNGADVNIRDRYGRTPLSCVLFREYCYPQEIEKTITLFKDHGAHEDVFAFFDAIEKKDIREMGRLLKENPNLINCRDLGEQLPLVTAVYVKDYGAAKFLIEHGANPDIKKDERDPLSIAVEQHNTPMAKMLIAYMKDQNNSAEYGKYLFSSLQYVIKKDMAMLLLSHGADIKARNSQKETPLHLASVYGDQEILKAIVSRGAEIDARDAYGETPLHKASGSGIVDTARFLINCGADINIRDKSGETPYIKAIENNRTEMAEFLLSKGADQTVRGKRDLPLLHDAASKGHLQVVEMLLSKGVSVDSRDSIGWTPLHHAAYEGRADVVKLLLDRGADLNAGNESGETPLLCALEKNHQDIAEILKAAGAKDGTPAR